MTFDTMQKIQNGKGIGCDVLFSPKGQSTGNEAVKQAFVVKMVYYGVHISCLCDEKIDKLLTLSSFAVLHC